MKKFHKFQLALSIIPVVSTVFIAFVTMFVFKKNKAAPKLWLYFCLTFFVSGIVASFVNNEIMTGLHPILNVIVIGLILTIANILLVELQITSAREST